MNGDLDALLDKVKACYRLYSHKAYTFAEFLKDHEIYLYSELPPEQVRVIHLKPVASPQGVVDSWLAEDSKAKIAFVDHTNEVALHIRDESSCGE